MQKFRLLIVIFFATFSTFSIDSALAFMKDAASKGCVLDQESFDQILDSVKNDKSYTIKSLANCLRYNYTLVFRACAINPKQLADAEYIFRNDENFVARLIKINSESLKYASKELQSDQSFIEQASYLNRDSLQYADPKILDNKPFMEKMIERDSHNYIFASNRIKKMSEIAIKALGDNGMLLANAPDEIKDDRKMVAIAMKSDSEAINYSSIRLQNDIEILLKKAPKQKNINIEQLRDFIAKHYLIKEEKRNIGKKINKNAKIFKKQQLIDRNYVTKWQKNVKFVNGKLIENSYLIAVEGRNYPAKWQDDLKKYPELVAKINSFFLNRNIDKDTINNLSLTYLWLVKENPLTIAFNLYLLRDSHDSDLGSEYSSITSLTAIAQRIDKNQWRLSVVETILDNEMKVDVTYENGHKKYFLQDLYLEDNQDKNPKIIFRVEDSFREYFEIFNERSNGKYKFLYKIDPLLPNKEDNSVAK